MHDHELVALVRSFLAKHNTGVTNDECHAWEEFFLRYDPVIRESVRRIHSAPEIVDDCTQDVWIVLIRRLPKWKYDPARAPIGAWVATIARRLATKRARRLATRRAERLGESHAGTLADPELGPDIEFERMQEHELFGALLLEFASRLPERVSRIVTMQFLESRSTPEIAHQLKLSDDCVRSILHRVIPKLRSFLHLRGLRPS
jgi:RNA polymerase sigma factor (sigma-70 family)